MPRVLQPLQPTSGDTTAQFAVVGVRPRELRAAADTVLREAGLLTLHVEDELAAIQALQEHDVVLGVVDAAMLGAAQPDQLRRLRQEPAIAGLPVILLSGGQELDVELMIQLGITDFVAGPVEGTDFAARVALVLAGSRATRRRKVAAARLRDDTRAISAALRGTNDPERMAALVVRGLGETFAGCHVRLETFPGERVPELAASWNRTVPAKGFREIPRQAALQLCAQLWEQETVLRVEDHHSPDDPESRILAAAAPPELRTSVFAPLAHGEQVLGYIWIAGTTGPRHWSRTELSLIQHVCGNLAHGLVQGHLITAQREVLSRLRELDQAKTDFVATVNHELRTPLTSITGYLELILDGSAGEVPAHMVQMLDIVGRNASRLNQLITDLLTISRSDAQASLAVEEIDLAALLESVAAALAPAAASNDIALRLAPMSAPFLVDGDETQLEQVFTNLFSNAVKFTPPGGTVDVLVDAVKTKSGPQVRVRIADTGIGIPEVEIPKLFRRFFRASNATAAAIPGTGLGLAIVQDIVLQHGGELDIDSVMGQGTTVTVHIPARR
jgi:two-component system phosphate regulon sensor histidine kinase PhoR